MKASILFIAYNQRRFVAEAIRSALAQDHVDLELVVCDDGSTDDTRAILEEELTRCPPHITVVRAHSEHNVGLVANFNRGMAACSGEVVIPMAGDDVSLPGRVSRIVHEFAGHPQRMVVVSNYRRIDAEGHLLPGSARPGTDRVFAYDGEITSIFAGAPVVGATAAYRATLAETFGPMTIAHCPEDRCYWVRGLILGEIRYVSEPLVLWRSHDENISNFIRRTDTCEARGKAARAMLVSQHHALQLARDIRLARDRAIVAPRLACRLLAVVDGEREKRRLRRYSLTRAPWKLWLASARRLLGRDRSYRAIRRVVFSEGGLRLSARRRDRQWSHLLTGGRPSSIDGDAAAVSASCVRAASTTPFSPPPRRHGRVPDR